MVTNISANKFSKLALLVVKEKDEGEVSISGTEGLDELDFATFEADEESLNARSQNCFIKNIQNRDTLDGGEHERRK